MHTRLDIGDCPILPQAGKNFQIAEVENSQNIVDEKMAGRKTETIKGAVIISSTSTG